MKSYWIFCFRCCDYYPSDKFRLTSLCPQHEAEEEKLDLEENISRLRRQNSNLEDEIDELEEKIYLLESED